MPVGNDVVDLQGPANQASTIHPRFDQRVFGDEELRRLEALGVRARHRLRWTLWAARESAYKWLAQREPGTPFRPTEMTVRLDGPLPGSPSGRVEWKGREIGVQVDCRPDRVHVVTLAEDGTAPVSALRRLASPAEDPASGDTSPPRPDPSAVSAAARVLAAGTVARTLDLRPADVRIATAPRRAIGRSDSEGSGPRAFRAGEALAVDLSISHDGDWIACAVLSLRRDPAAAR